MSEKMGTNVIIILNIIEIICPIYFAIPYLMHDTTVSNPSAMLPAEKWDASDMSLTYGLISLAIVNVFALIFVGKGKITRPLTILFLIPCIICLGIVAHY